MSTRASNARHVRQRKLNTKQPLRIIRESDIEEQPDDEAQRHIPQIETGVEKAEEIEYHLQAVINAKTNDSFIPTPEATKARGIQYDKLYPKDFSQPATYIRFSSTVEDSVGVAYCMNDDDVAFLARLNDGKDVNGRDRKDKLSQCSVEAFEEVMNFFEETSARIQPFANLDNAPILSLEEMQQSTEDALSPQGQSWLRLIYQYWVLRKGTYPLMPSIKVRMLDTTSDADDADPYVCFRRREVRQTRKTRGRDAQVVEKLKKLRLELEQARLLVQLVVQRERLNKEQLEVSRKVFEQRGQLKKVKIEKGIVGEKGEDEDLLVNQKPMPKPKPRQSNAEQKPATIRIPSIGSRQAPDNDLVSLADLQSEAQHSVEQTIDQRKSQHRRWNDHWVDGTWRPITPPLDPVDSGQKWAPLLPNGQVPYPTPPPSLPSVGSQEKDVDVDMKDQPPPTPPKEPDAVAGAAMDWDFVLSMPGAWPASPPPEQSYEPFKRDSNPACRLRYGRGGRLHLEARKQRFRGVCKGVVTDSDDSEDEEGSSYFNVSDRIIFDYRCALNRSAARPDTGERRSMSAAEIAAAAAPSNAANVPQPSVQQRASVGSAG